MTVDVKERGRHDNLLVLSRGLGGPTDVTAPDGRPSRGPGGAVLHDAEPQRRRRGGGDAARRRPGRRRADGIEPAAAPRPALDVAGAPLYPAAAEGAVDQAAVGSARRQHASCGPRAARAVHGADVGRTGTWWFRLFLFGISVSALFHVLPNFNE